MFSYYKKVFLWPIRFCFIESLLTSVGGFLGSALTGAASGAGSAAASGLVGGSSEDDMAAAVAERQREKDRAGGQGDISSVQQVESMSQTAGRKLGEFGHKMASDFLGQVSRKFVGNTVEGIFNPKVDPRKQGMRQRAFTSAAFPGVNPWELAGGSAGGGSGGVGGTAAPSIGARATRGAADIAAAPRLSSVKLDYEKWPHQAKLIGAETGGVEAGTELTKAREVLTKLESDWLPTMKQAQSNLETTAATKNVVEQQKILQGVELERQKIVTEIQRSGLTKYNKQVQKAYANILKPIANSEVLAGVVLAMGTILGIFKGIPALKNVLKGKGLKKKVIPGT